MAELLVRVVDKVNDDFYLNLKCSKRGDVIAVVPDGWAWTSNELTNPDWRIIRVNLTVDEAKSFLKIQDDGKLPKDPTKSKTLARRESKINLDSILIPAAVQVAIADNTRATSIIDASAFNINLVKVVKVIAVDTGPI